MVDRNCHNKFVPTPGDTFIWEDVERHSVSPGDLFLYTKSPSDFYIIVLSVEGLEMKSFVISSSPGVCKMAYFSNYYFTFLKKVWNKVSFSNE